MGRTAFVLGGGGLKGGFQAAAALTIMERHGITPDEVHGVSVGAINALALAQERPPDVIRADWLSIREADIHRKPSWLKLAARVFGAPGVYDHTPLYRRLVREVGRWGVRKPCFVGCVDVCTGTYEHVDISTAPTEEQAAWYVWASATMPIWSPVGDSLVDGGVRNVTPLGHVMDRDAVARAVVITCSPADGVEPADPPRNNLAYWTRCLDIALDEIARNDIRATVALNRVVAQAAAHGVTLRKPDGTPYRALDLYVYHAPRPLGGTLDDDPYVLRQRWEAGVIAGSMPLALRRA